MIAFTVFAVAATLRTLAHPVVRSHVDRNNAAVSILSTDTVNTFHGHALLAQAAYCENAAAALPQIDMLLVGGDGGKTPRFFVGHDPSSNNLVVAHEGTATNNISSIAIDAQFPLSPLNATFFPNSPSGTEVHLGFGKTFELTANEILEAVRKGISTKNSATVLVSGHSLGAALAVMTSIFLKQNLNGLNVSTAVFGLPRGGNQAWADFVDTNLPNLRHMHNQHDIVPTVPPRFLQYQHPSGELFIQPAEPHNVVFCPGEENPNCSDGNNPLQGDIAMHKGPYTGLLMGRSECPVLNQTAAA